MQLAILIGTVIVILGIIAIVAMLMSIKDRMKEDKSATIVTAVREELRLSREETSQNAKLLREEVGKAQNEANVALVNTLNKLGTTQNARLEEVVKSLNQVVSTTKQENELLRDKLQKLFNDIQQSNENKLEQMRKTVDEKLHETLEKRLGESFKLVGDQLQAVQKGLGEMQSLANGVGDLKRVLTNVKARGTWGEYQLEAILEQILNPDQYEKNVKPKEGSRETVEFAIKLPGMNGDQRPVWLPIDAKFPKEDYERLVDAAQVGDADLVKQATAALAREIEKCAGDIHSKYINPPVTTDFAIMFLPTEGLYAEVLRQPGLQDMLQQKYRVVATGPTTLAALLNSLRVGFRTLAIEKRSSEVWQILAAVKTEFGKFGEVLDKIKRQVSTVSNSLDETTTRTRAMERKLRTVEELPHDQAQSLLELPDTVSESDAIEEDTA